ncbi:hypothetical protein T11_949 [Trichinella zimbabwensis]|uniref:Uncharacterized protein n=2 Tax=Trichinella TaxID=6333 RepID=A0A0V1LY63_9BILA|nr:hypothetical protein T11_949 [Trichinella zimbabwensis]KRZ64401.1 hypothetical protein T10_8773 [Trichinella papuae]
MNRNKHGEERRKVEQATSSERMDRLDRIVRWSIAFVRQLRRNKRPILHYFITMMIM